MAASNRENETRAAKERGKSWKPPELLPVPDKEDGFSYRWVRVGSRGQLDNKNISKRMREGWTPVNAADHPELEVMNDHGARFEDGVEVGGLLLMKTATENIKARNNYYNQRSNDQMASVDSSYMRESDPRMPLLKPERRSKVTFGNGSSE
jgi:hypothetical protein